MAVECDHQWEQTDLFGCESCGDHPGVRCTRCYETLDAIWDAEECDQAYAQIRERTSD